MAEWDEKEFRPSRLTDDGQYYQAVGTEENPVEIQAIEIIKALGKMAEDEREERSEVKGVRVRYGRIEGDLDIQNAHNLERVENGKYIKLPLTELIFYHTIFDGNVDFQHVQFGEKTDFWSSQFGKKTDFRSSQFGKLANFHATQFGKKTDFGSSQFGERADFKFAQFGDETSFSSAQFGEFTNFGNVCFGKETVFLSAKFGKGTYFSSARFGELTSFGYAQFGDEISFNDARFGRFTDFSFALFGDKTLFYSAQFGGETSFSSARFGNETNFSSAWFRGKLTDFRFAQFKHPAWFEDIRYWSDYVRITWGDWLWKDGMLGKVLKKFLFFPKNSPEGKPEKSAQFLLDSQHINEFSNAMFKRYVADQHFIRECQENYPGWYRLWRWSSNCGRSIGLWAFWSLIIALLSGLVYAHKSQILFGLLGIASLGVATVCTIKRKWRGLTILVLFAVFWGLLCTHIIVLPDSWQPKLVVSHSVQTNDGYVEEDKTLYRSPTWFTYIYFSVVTFTTLGFGDVTPLNTAGEVLLTIEVILGYVMLGGLISIFANKLARRS